MSHNMVKSGLISGGHMRLEPDMKIWPDFGRGRIWYAVQPYLRHRRLSWPGWLVTYQNKCPAPDTVTHLSTNWARCRLTSLIETNALLLHQTTTTVYCFQQLSANPAELCQCVWMASALDVVHPEGKGIR